MRNGSSRCCSGCVTTRVSFTPAPSEVGSPACTRSTARLRVTASMLVVVAIAKSPVHAAASGRDDFLDLLPGGGDALALGLLAHREAFGIHEAHVGHAEEGEHRPQIGYLRIGRRVAIEPAARERDVDGLSLKEPFRPLFGVAERDARARDGVDPVLELR